jgi:hypothetical protein
MSYYARHKQLETFKANFTGISYPKKVKAYFSIFSLTNTKISVLIPDLNQILHL